MRPGETITRADGGRSGGRRRDIDWLRIAAALLLIPFHTVRVFNWEEDFSIRNVPTGVASQRFIDFVGPWRMSLLFLLAGAATWLAFRFRSGGQYAGERRRAKASTATPAASRPGAEPGEEEQRGSPWFERGILAVIGLIIFFTVVLPLLLWAAAIIFAGSRV